jgi:pimeloyl-[acyl-carrier protein] methyl ester esterase
MRVLHRQTLSANSTTPVPELVLLHGWGSDSQVWAPLLPLLREHFTITLIDLPGFGGSSACHIGPELDEWCDAIQHIAPQQAIWLGWSLGGQLALAIAARAPSRVQALVLVACNPCFVQRPGWASAMPAEVFAAFRQRLETDPQEARHYFNLLQSMGSPSRKQDVAFLQAQRRECSDSALGAGLDLLATTDLRSTYAALTIPTLNLLGSDDQLVPASLARTLPLRRSATAQLIAGSGHLPFLSQPDAFMTALLSFSTSQEAA